ncbi:N-acetyltransferase [Brachybacterium vulturis]|uniref:N-acetyltransferase n=1 Tax=Brachybacterium vulturis TaxID=2017484 RepID=A0A291GN55_9MICO|nr:GNAT family N-acetyltransferase [Brachybacterium vulturis]ATG51759.1 N-acetyltransferase [Brachybacterium vulturis]
MSTPSRRFRPATPADAARDGHRFAWLKPDGWRESFRALVLEVEDGGGGATVIGVGRIGPNTVHPGLDLVELEIDPAHRRQGHGTALLHELGTYSNNSLSSKVQPGSERDSFLRSHGAVTYLEVPLLRVDVTADRTARWCAAVRGATEVQGARAVPWTALHREQLVDALTDRYAWQHASWSPTAPREVLRRKVGAEFFEESVREHSWAVVRDGEITALADLYDDERGSGGPVGPHREGALEAVDAAAPQARADVALCMAAMLEDLRELGAETLDLDNHPTDPHTAPLLATLDRTEVDPVQLVEIPNGLTAVLRDVP